MKKGIMVLLAAILILSLTGCKNRDYESGILAYANGEYTKALEYLARVDESYEDAAGYIKLAQEKQKFETYDPNFQFRDVNYLDEPTTPVDQQAAKRDLEDDFCSPWYRDGADGNLFVIDETNLDGRRYCVRAMGEFVDGHVMVFYYPEDPNTLYYAMSAPYSTDPYNRGLFIFPVGTETDWEPTATSRTDAEIAAEWAAMEEAQAAWEREHARRYGDEHIVELARTQMLSEVGGYFGSLGASATLKSSKVEYDSYSKTYYCTINIYVASIVDCTVVPGTYHAELEYQDTGSGLKLANIVYYRMG